MNGKWSTTSQESLAVSYKGKQAIQCNPLIAHWYLSIYVENLHPHLRMNVYSNFVYNCKTWKQGTCHSAGEMISCGAARQ
jgi:hypothetical protein